mgnify:FL=1
MLYCPKCQVLSTDDKICPSCGSKKLREPEQNDPVLLLTADEAKTEMIEAAFEEHNIPYEERISGLGGPPSIILGKVANTNKNIFVPFGQIDACEELLNGIGILDAEDAEIQKRENEAADIQARELADDESESAEMSPGKRFLWRAVSVVLFIAIVWAVVSAADYAAGALKDFFAGR